MSARGQPLIDPSQSAFNPSRKPLGFREPSRGVSSLKPEEILSHIRSHWLQENGLHWCKDAILGEDDLFAHSSKSSQLLGFLKSIVVSVGFQMMGSVSKFVDTFAANPKTMTQQLMRSG